MVALGAVPWVPGATGGLGERVGQGEGALWRGRAGHGASGAGSGAGPVTFFPAATHRKNPTPGDRFPDFGQESARA
jgi:hypothetical protein